MKLSRRAFFHSVGLGALGASLPHLAFAGSGQENSDDIILSLFLRGAADGLNVVPPWNDDDYYRLRPDLALSTDEVLDLDGSFGLHPGMAPLLPVYQQGDLAVIHAVGSPSPSHSHFEAQNLMERGVVEGNGSFDGWLGRWLDYRMDDSFGVFHAVGMGNAAPTTLAHDASTIALPSIQGFALQVPEDQRDASEAMLRAIHETGNLLDQRAVDTLEAVNKLAEADPAAIPPQNGAEYPATPFGEQLQALGQLVRADIGLRAGAISLGGWDTHQGQVPTLESLTADLAQGLAAFHTDMGEAMQRITLVVQTEFGRRAYQNGSQGTDHGHASFMLALGGHVNGGKVFTDWPGLRDQDLYGAGDLEVTIDYRSVLAELIDKRTSGMPLESLFPDFDNSAGFPGVFY